MDFILIGVFAIQACKTEIHCYDSLIGPIGGRLVIIQSRFNENQAYELLSQNWPSVMHFFTFLHYIVHFRTDLGP